MCIIFILRANDMFAFLWLDPPALMSGNFHSPYLEQGSIKLLKSIVFNWTPKRWYVFVSYVHINLVLECVEWTGSYTVRPPVSLRQFVQLMTANRAWHRVNPGANVQISMHLFYPTKKRLKCRKLSRSDADCTMPHIHVEWPAHNPWSCLSNRPPCKEKANVGVIKRKINAMISFSAVRCRNSALE